MFEMTEPLIEIKSYYLTQPTVYAGLHIHHVIMKVNQIKKLIKMSIAYSHYRKRNHKLLSRGLFYEIYDPATGDITVEAKRFRIGKKMIPEIWMNQWKEIIDIMIKTPLPFEYTPRQNMFHDVIIHLVNREFIESTSCCWIFGTFPYILSRKNYLKEMMVDMVEYVYQIKTQCMLILPEKSYAKNILEEREKYSKITQIGLSNDPASKTPRRSIFYPYIPNKA